MTLPSPPPLTRRAVLAGLGALPFACRGRPPLAGEVLSARWMNVGHRVRDAAVPAPRQTDRAEVVIVGAGVAGLAAGWRLVRAGYAGKVVQFDVGDRPGGTSMAGGSRAGPFAMGAHYITMPSPECRHVRAMLADFGVITGFDADGRPRYDPLAVCLAPQERLYVAGEWIDGLWPETLAGDEDERQRLDFEARCDALTRAVGADGKPAFAIPVERSSEDPAYRALADVSFAAWLDAQGYTSPLLRALVEYDVRDDFGTSLADTSAWAALHYHCARRPDPADARDLGTHVLTWPAGNGWLVGRLEAALPWDVITGSVARRVEAGADGVRIVWDAGPVTRETVARHVILAVPTRVARRLLGLHPANSPDFAPWRVAYLHLTALPAGRGVVTAWDSVVHGSRSLGYVSSAHQTGRYGGRTVLTWYEPLSDVPPAAGREALAAATWEAERDHVLADLRPAHPGLEDALERLDVFHWAHGTARPVVGAHRPGALAALRADVPAGVSLAHTDLSGMSLFEEATWHGVRAAEEALAALGVATETLL